MYSRPVLKEPKASANFGVLCYTEIKNSDWMLQVIRLFLTDQSTTDLELEDGRIDRFGAVTFEDVDNLLDDGLPNRHLPTKKYYFFAFNCALSFYSLSFHRGKSDCIPVGSYSRSATAGL